MSFIYQVCVLGTKHDFFDYRCKQGDPCIGARVIVPFRKRNRMGIIINRIQESKITQLKFIEEILDQTPFLTEELLSLCQWISQYYQSSLSEVLLLALTKRDREGKPISKRLKLNLLNGVEKEELSLNSIQNEVVQAISKHLNHYRCFLLKGVTGSGKTEVYIEIIQKIINSGKQALVIVPEIGLTPQLIARFEKRLFLPIGVIHSNISETQRQWTWQAAKGEDLKIIIGTRSAIFTPLPKLGLIVIDEEHDYSLKQFDGVHYSARDTALVRAKVNDIPIILGSATPSLESLYNCQTQKYHLLTLSQKALNQNPIRFQIVDMRNCGLQEGFTETTLNRMKKHLDEGNQVLVFLNRRGFSPVLLCHACGWIADCKGCDTHLTLHRAINKLICHHCDVVIPIPTLCMQCKKPSLLPIGLGTERIESFLKNYFPEINCARIDRDTIRKKNDMIEQLNLIHQGHTQLMIGTQMLAKGHHFPRLTLVVVLEVDGGFNHQDFRAAERLGQLITQVSGRAGRADQSGEVLIQTHFPNQPLLKTLIEQGYDTYSQELLMLRKEAQLPPYSHLALVSAKHRTASKVLHFLHELKDKIKDSHISVLGPAPAVIARKAHHHRFQLLLKSDSRSHLQKVLSQLKKEFFYQALGVKWGIDVDPLDLS